MTNVMIEIPSDLLMHYINEQEKITLVQTIMESIKEQDSVETIRKIVNDKKYDDEGP